MNELSLIQKIAIWALPLLFAITVHEVAHGWVASKRGDSTAKMLGRLTLNPIKHIDPMGTIVIPLILLTLGGFIFGWAKPVPVNYQHLKHPRTDIALVAAAGPFANLLMAFLWGIVAKLGIFLLPYISMPANFMIYTGRAGIFINIILMVLNLVPIPPLDGSKVVLSLFSPNLSRKIAPFEIYGFLILVALLASGILANIIQTPILAVYRIILSIIGL